MKLKLKMFMKILVVFDFSNYSAKSKYYDNSNALVVDKMKEEIAGLPIKKFVGLKPNMYLFLVDYSSKNKNAKGVNKNFVASTSHNECKDVLLNKNCLRHLRHS